jgi:hypothetical protein
MVSLVQEMKCPECGGATNVVTVGAADYPRCPNGHNLLWTPSKGLRVLEPPDNVRG